MSQLKVGQKFRAERITSGDVTVGKVYEIAGYDKDGDAYFVDDAGDHNFAMCGAGNLQPDGFTPVE